jgi:hypothetical protein
LGASGGKQCEGSGGDDLRGLHFGFPLSIKSVDFELVLGGITPS